jgi:hypothetical protein
VAQLYPNFYLSVSVLFYFLAALPIEDPKVALLLPREEVHGTGNTHTGSGFREEQRLGAVRFKSARLELLLVPRLELLQLGRKSIAIGLGFIQGGAIEEVLDAPSGRSRESEKSLVTQS